MGYRQKIVAPQYGRRGPIAYHPDFALYEKLKREWTEANPHASDEARRAAIAEIASRCGI